MYKTYNLMQNYKNTSFLFMIVSVKTEEEIESICDHLNAEKPVEYKGNKIDWNQVEYFSYNKDVNNDLIF